MGKVIAMENEIRNLRAKKSVKMRLEAASTPGARLRGLMFRKKCDPLLFTFDSEGNWPIHSFFVAFPFDAIYLSSKKKVTGVFHSVRPFLPHVAPSLPSKYLLELPAGTAKKLSARIGDSIDWGD